MFLYPLSLTSYLSIWFHQYCLRTSNFSFFPFRVYCDFFKDAYYWVGTTSLKSSHTVLAVYTILCSIQRCCHLHSSGWESAHTSDDLVNATFSLDWCKHHMLKKPSPGAAHVHSRATLLLYLTGTPFTSSLLARQQKQDAWENWTGPNISSSRYLARTGCIRDFSICWMNE